MKRMLSFVAAAGLVMAGVAGCSGSGDGGSGGDALTPEAVVGTWTLVDGKGPEGEVKPLADHPIELVVQEDGAFSGTSGCNNIMGTMVITDGVVDMGAIGQTMMACEEDAMKVEYAYTQALNEVTAGSATADKLTLRGTDTELNYKKS